MWLLRFYDEGDGSTFDIPIDPGIHSWYVELWAAHKTYHAELGLCTVHGVFESLCRSNTITTPPAAPAPQQEPQWLAVTGALEQAQMVNAPAAEAEESSQRSEISDQQAEVGPELAVAPGSTAQDFPLCEPPHAGVATPVVVAAELEPPAALAAVLEEKPASSAAPTPETAPAGSSEGVSSFSMGGGVGKAAIELELHAEVVVYGRAQPGQTLRVNGRPVPVNDDGTFHVRWALPVTKP